jgi:hypothetical protein
VGVDIGNAHHNAVPRGRHVGRLVSALSICAWLVRRLVVGNRQHSNPREDQMNYLMFVCVDDAVKLSPEERATIGPDVEAWMREMDERGVRLQGHQLAPVSDATTVRVRKGEVLLADGPFAETKEHIGGFDILACENLDEAIEVAARHPVARFGTIEVRPFLEG